MHNHLTYKFLEKFELLYPFQFGFREKPSATQALLSLDTESSKHSLGNGKFGCGIFLDLQKAFDTVNHDILIKKLEHYGIRGNVLNWFKFYLGGRYRYVTVNGHSSDLLAISCGVSQDYVLGPLLFLIYVNDLPNISKFPSSTFLQMTQVSILNLITCSHYRKLLIENCTKLENG